MANKVLEVEFRAKDAMTAQLQKMGGSTDQLARKMKELNNAGNKGGGGGGSEDDASGGGLKGLADSLGSRRLLSRVIGGGIAGLIGSQLAEATGKAAEFVDQFRQGKISAGEMGVKIAESLPIIGGFVTAGQNIREMFTHEKADLDAINEKIKLQNQFIDYQKNVLEQTQKRWRDIGETIQRIQQRANLSGATGYDKQELERQYAAQQRVQQLSDKRDDEKAAAQKAADAQIKSVGEQAQSGKLSETDYRSYIKQYSDTVNKQKKDIDQKYNKAIAIEQNASYFEEIAARQQHYQETLKVVQNYEGQLADTQAEARQQQLKANGQTLQAELEQINDAGEKKKRAIQDQLQEQLDNASPELRGAIHAAADKELDAIDQETAAARDAAAKKSKDEAAVKAKEKLDQQKAALRDNEEMGKNLREQQKSLLQSNVDNAYGFAQTLSAKRKSVGFDLKSQLTEEIQEYQKTLTDPAATEAQRKAALANIQQFIGQSAKTFDRETRGQQFALNHLATSEGGAHLTGVGAEARERGDVELAKTQLKASQDALKVQQDMQQMLAQFTQWFYRNAQQGGTTAWTDN